MAFWDRQLTAAEAPALYADGTTPAALLTKLTRPSGSVYAQVAYDPLTGRVTSDTDSNGGTWQLHPPTRGRVQPGVRRLGAGGRPGDYYRLNDTGATKAADTVSCDCGRGPAGDLQRRDRGGGRRRRSPTSRSTRSPGPAPT